MKSNSEIINALFAPHKFSIAIHEYGMYRDMEIAIDGEYSGILINDKGWYADNNSDLGYLVRHIEEYLSAISNRDCHKCIYAYAQKSDILDDQRVPILECSRREYKKSCYFVDKGHITLKG